MVKKSKLVLPNAFFDDRVHRGGNNGLKTPKNKIQETHYEASKFLKTKWLVFHTSHFLLIKKLKKKDCLAY